MTRRVKSERLADETETLTEYAIAHYVYQHGPMTRGEIADALDIVPSTVSRSIRNLVRAGILSMSERETETRGQNPKEYSAGGPHLLADADGIHADNLPDDIDVESMSPGWVFIAAALYYNGKSSQRDLVDATGISQSTIRNGLEELEARGHVESRPKFADARQSVYWLVDADGEEVKYGE